MYQVHRVTGYLLFYSPFQCKQCSAPVPSGIPSTTMKTTVPDTSSSKTNFLLPKYFLYLMLLASEIKKKISSDGLKTTFSIASLIRQMILSGKCKFGSQNYFQMFHLW